MTSRSPSPSRTRRAARRGRYCSPSTPRTRWAPCSRSPPAPTASGSSSSCKRAIGSSWLPPSGRRIPTPRIAWRPRIRRPSPRPRSPGRALPANTPTGAGVGCSPPHAGFRGSTGPWSSRWTATSSCAACTRRPSGSCSRRRPSSPRSRARASPGGGRCSSATWSSYPTATGATRRCSSRRRKRCRSESTERSPTPTPRASTCSATQRPLIGVPVSIFFAPGSREQVEEIVRHRAAGRPAPEMYEAVGPAGRRLDLRRRDPRHADHLRRQGRLAGDSARHHGTKTHGGGPARVRGAVSAALRAQPRGRLPLDRGRAASRVQPGVRPDDGLRLAGRGDGAVRRGVPRRARRRDRTSSSVCGGRAASSATRARGAARTAAPSG